MTSSDVVQQFLEHSQARNWRAAEALLHEHVAISYTSTGERFEGPSFLAMNEAYPDGWHLTVVELIANGDRVAAQVKVVQDDLTFWCAGFTPFVPV